MSDNQEWEAWRGVAIAGDNVMCLGQDGEDDFYIILVPLGRPESGEPKTWRVLDLDGFFFTGMESLIGQLNDGA